MLSYGLRKRQSWKQERYYAKGTNYVKLIFRGKTPCICFNIEPSSLAGTKYSVEDVSGIKKYEDVPSMMRVRSGRGAKYAVELIQMMMETAGIKQQREVQDEFEPIPAMTKEELVNFVESAMLYALSFDLLVPPFDLVKVASVEQINAKIESAKMRTGKRMGYKYNSDDVLENE